MTEPTNDATTPVPVDVATGATRRGPTGGQTESGARQVSETGRPGAEPTVPDTVVLPPPLDEVVRDHAGGAGPGVDDTMRDLAASETTEDPRETRRKETVASVSERYLEAHKGDADRETTLAENLTKLNTSTDAAEIVAAKEALGISFEEATAMLPENDERILPAREKDAEDRRNKMAEEFEAVVGESLPAEDKAHGMERLKKLQNVDGTVSEKDRIEAAIESGGDRIQLERAMRSLGCEGDLTEFLDKVEAAKAAPEVTPAPQTGEQTTKTDEEAFEELQEEVDKLVKEKAEKTLTEGEKDLILAKIKDLWHRTGVNKKNWWVWALALGFGGIILGSLVALKALGQDKK
jgi:hypothetical protein